MNNYELVYIVDAHAPQSTKDEISKQVADSSAKAGVKVLNNQMWLERHKMSFPIQKIMEGTYYLLNLEAPSASILKLQSMLQRTGTAFFDSQSGCPKGCLTAGPVIDGG